LYDAVGDAERHRLETDTSKNVGSEVVNGDGKELGMRKGIAIHKTQFRNRQEVKSVWMQGL
jgi:hypothetical protein